MHIYSFESAYLSLENILHKIQNAAEVQSSFEVSEHARNAIAFHNLLKTEYKEAIQEIEKLQCELYELTRDPAEDSSDHSTVDCTKYITLRDAGATADVVYQALVADGLGRIQSLKVLRTVYELSLQQALDVVNSPQS